VEFFVNNNLGIKDVTIKIIGMTEDNLKSK
jgi:hypothetical protein